MKPSIIGSLLTFGQQKIPAEVATTNLLAHRGQWSLRIISLGVLLGFAGQCFNTHLGHLHRQSRGAGSQEVRTFSFPFVLPGLPQFFHFRRPSTASNKP